MVGLVARRIKGGKPRRQDHSAHRERLLHRLHLVINGPCQASRNTLIALGANAAGETAQALFAHQGFGESLLDLFKVPAAALSGKEWHLGPRGANDTFQGDLVHRA